ncbi:MAG TPA: glycosyltransferase family A protein [Bryobacteraceae bacterium]|nr:glycosyltransferase family A protein [Bryobacteraceae bacterium]
MVSILCSTYNHEAFLASALDSVRAQTHTDWELIIVNDASTDGTDAILDRYSRLDRRIKVVHNTSHRPVPENLNRALELARGDYIARIDSDDFWTDPRKLDWQLDHFRKFPALALVGTWANAVDESGKVIYKLDSPVEDEAIRRWILLRNPFVSSSIVMKTDLARQCGGFHPREETYEDYGLWLRLGSLGSLANMPVYMVGYRLIASGLTWTKNEIQLRGSLRLVRKFRDRYPHHRIAAIKWRLHVHIARWIGAGGLSGLRRLLDRASINS